MKVAVCTPTKNRRWCYEFSKACLQSQTLKHDMWVVLDNSDDPEQDWSVCTSDESVAYAKVEGNRPIGWMRNRCLEMAIELGADYIVFWDDDDYYPPTRIQEGVNALLKDPLADISASSKMFILLTKENQLMTTGPFHGKHGTAATFTIRRRYAETNRFDETKLRGEELSFTKEWTANLVQVEHPENMIVVMGHSRNTVDKSDLAVQPKRYNAVSMNSDNGRMKFRSVWNVEPRVWDLFRRTFSV